MTLRLNLLALGLGLLLSLVGSSARSAGPAQLDWSRHESALVLRLEERSDKLAQVEPLVVELWGDGRLVARRPEPYANAGVFETRLPQQEMERVLRRLASPAFVDFEAGRVEDEKQELVRARRAAAEARGESPPLHYRSEKERVSLELHLSKYREEGGRAPRVVDQLVEWRGLRQDLDEFSGHESLEGLAAAVEVARELLALATGSDR